MYAASSVKNHARCKLHDLMELAMCICSTICIGSCHNLLLQKERASRILCAWVFKIKKKKKRKKIISQTWEFLLSQQNWNTEKNLSFGLLKITRPLHSQYGGNASNYILQLWEKALSFC